MEPPTKPDETDCCNSGCNPCILDVYEEQLRKYQNNRHGTTKTAKNYLSPTSFSIFKLVSVENHSKDCKLYTFEYVKPKALPYIAETNDNVTVIYEPGQHLLLKANVYGEPFQKAYTPLFTDNQSKNQFTVLVKLYENGRMSRFFNKLRIGSETLWRGPYGDFRINYDEENILFIAQGTGIAPFYSIICEILKNEECYTFLWLFYCCNSENVLLHEELYKLTQFWNFKYYLFLSGGNKDNFQKKYNEIVQYSRMGIDDIGNFLGQTKGHVKVMVCGAESFCENVKNILVQCEVRNEDITVF